MKLPTHFHTKRETQAYHYYSILNTNSCFFFEIGLRQTMKTRWFVYDKKAGKLKYYRDESHELQGELPIGQLDLSTATFCYDVETDTSGEFTIV